MFFLISYFVNRFNLIIRLFLKRKSTTRNVLIIKCDDLGDAAIWCHTAPQLYNYYNNMGYRVTFLGSAPYEILGNKFKFFDEFMRINLSKFGLKEIRVLSNLTFKNDIHEILVPSYSRFLGQGYRRISWALPSSNKIYVDKFKHKSFFARVVQENLDAYIFNKTITLDKADGLHELEFNKQVLASITKSTPVNSKTLKKDIRTICIFPGCKGSNRRWPTDKFFKLATKLKHSGYSVKIIALLHELDPDFVLELNNEIECLTHLSLEECIDQISESDCIVGNDSGPIHVGKLLQKTVVVLGWGGMYSRFLNYSRPDNYSVLMDRALCTSCNCSKNGNLAMCLDTVTVNGVAACIERMR